MTTQTQIETEYPYTYQQWQALDDERKHVIRSVAEYLSGEKQPEYPTDETLSEALNLLRPCKGCVPEEEIDDHLAKAIRKKFAAVYWMGLELANQELLRRGHKPGQDFNLRLVIDPDHEDFTYVTIVDPDRSNCFLHEGHSAWHFHFDSLNALADTVLSIRNLLVSRVMDTPANKHEIFVEVHGGRVQTVTVVPCGISVTVLDYDTEGEDDERLEKSPLNGFPCCIHRF